MGLSEIKGIDLESSIPKAITGILGRQLPLIELLKIFPTMAMWEVVEALKSLETQGVLKLCNDCRYVIKGRFKHGPNCGTFWPQARYPNALIQGEI